MGRGTTSPLWLWGDLSGWSLDHCPLSIMGIVVQHNHSWFRCERESRRFISHQSTGLSFQAGLRPLLFQHYGDCSPGYAPRMLGEIV